MDICNEITSLPVDIRELERHEIDLHRDIRLRSLSEAADVLGVTFAEMFSKPIEFWARKTQEVTAEQLGVLLIAAEGARPIGLIYGYVESLLAATGYVAGLWVEPIYRRRGIGYRLLNAALEWAHERSLAELLLCVHAQSKNAIQLYLRNGFQFNGRQIPFPLERTEHMLEMMTSM